jgi:hypothetical protein
MAVAKSRSVVMTMTRLKQRPFKLREDVAGVAG